MNSLGQRKALRDPAESVKESRSLGRFSRKFAQNSCVNKAI